MIRNAGRSHEIDMCNGPILPKMLQFTLPLMASSLLQLFFNTADIIVVGRFAGDNSLAAVGSNTSLINLFTHLFIGMSVAGNILASRYYGAKEKEALHQTVHTSMLLSLISGTLLAFVGFFSARTILTWMKSPPEVLDLAVLYLQIYFLAVRSADKIAHRHTHGHGSVTVAELSVIICFENSTHRMILY